MDIVRECVVFNYDLPSVKRFWTTGKRSYMNVSFIIIIIIGIDHRNMKYRHCCFVFVLFYQLYWSESL